VRREGKSFGCDCLLFGTAFLVVGWLSVQPTLVRAQTQGAGSEMTCS
jgi:hypothetical protein